MTGLEQVRILDLKIFREVCGAKSIRAVARRMDMTPGQISKAIQNFEKKIGFQVFKRSAAGVLRTVAGHELLVLVETILEAVGKVDQLVDGGFSQPQRRTLAFASTSFLISHFVAPTVSRLESSMTMSAATDDEMNFRFLDLSTEALVETGLRGAFEIAVHYDKIAWPATWESQYLGKSKWVLVVRTDHSLKSGASLSDILHHRFVVPTYWTGDGLSRGDDQFPIPFSKRQLGFETATADAAMSVLLNTDQVAFLPEILVRSSVESKRLRIVSQPAAEVEKDVYLSLRSDLVPARFSKELRKQLIASLAIVSKFAEKAKAKSEKPTPLVSKPDYSIST